MSHVITCYPQDTARSQFKPYMSLHKNEYQVLEYKIELSYHYSL